MHLRGRVQPEGIQVVRDIDTLCHSWLKQFYCIFIITLSCVGTHMRLPHCQMTWVSTIIFILTKQRNDNYYYRSISNFSFIERVVVWQFSELLPKRSIGRTQTQWLLSCVTILWICLALRSRALWCSKGLGARPSPLRPLHSRYSKTGCIALVRRTYLPWRYTISWLM